MTKKNCNDDVDVLTEPKAEEADCAESERELVGDRDGCMDLETLAYILGF